ncbi:MAG: hypothetical protein ACI9LO_001747 [Planctomycetota bacterium]|jgi:hypothetical protein
MLTLYVSTQLNWWAFPTFCATFNIAETEVRLGAGIWRRKKTTKVSRAAIGTTVIRNLIFTAS